MVIQSSLALAVALTAISPQPPRQMNTESAYEQSFGQEKEGRTPEQEKIDSQLLYAIYQWRGEAESKGVPIEPIQLEKRCQRTGPRGHPGASYQKSLGASQRVWRYSCQQFRPLSFDYCLSSSWKVRGARASREVKFIAPKAQSMTN